jgi:GR25 family glycosyltransferase involved in LPS biosynthesis
MRTICLTLDKRIKYAESYIVPEFKNRLNLDVELFIAGDGLSVQRPYDYIDDPLSLPMRFERSTNYDTWFTRPNAYNAFKAHRAIFEKVIADGDERFLLLEDDVYIEEDFEQIIGDNLDELTKVLDYDMLYLGSYNASKVGQIKSPNLLYLPRLSNVGGFHAVILTKQVIKRLLEIPPYGPYDWIASRYIHGNIFNCLAVNPSVITQKDGFSYVEGHELRKPHRSI